MASFYRSVAQLDRAPVSQTEGRGFESLPVKQSEDYLLGFLFHLSHLMYVNLALQVRLQVL